MARFNIESNIAEQTGLFNQFGGVLGGLPTILGTVRGAVNALSAALAANPIGAAITVIVAAVGAVTASLSRLQPVVDEINIRIAQLSAAWSFLVDTVGSYLGIADAPTRTFNETVAAAGNLERATQTLADEQNELIVTTARLNAAISEQRLIAADATASEAERIAALQEAQRLTNELYDAEQEVLERRLAILQEQQSLGSNTREDDMEAARLQAELINLQSSRNNALRETTSMLSALEKAQRMATEATADDTEATMAAIKAAEERAAAESRYAEIAASNTLKAEEIKQDAVLSTAQVTVGALAQLLGDSKGAQIAGLVATQAFEAAKVITAGARGTAEATISASALSVATFGASIAALPAQLAAISASTTAGLAAVGVATGVGIAGILSSPGASPSGGSSGGAPSAQGFVGGPTVRTPELESGTPSADAQAMIGAMMAQSERSVVAVIADGEVQRENERNARLNRRRTLGN